MQSYNDAEAKLIRKTGEKKKMIETERERERRYVSVMSKKSILCLQMEKCTLLAL